MKTRHSTASMVIGVALVGALLAGCSSGNGSATTVQAGTPASATQHKETLAQRAADAYVWGYPLVVTERTLQSLSVLGENQLFFQPKLSDITSRTVVAPNTDTLYAISSMDLRGEPYVLTLPAIHDRYYAFQFLSAYTDSFAYIGTRATGGRAGRWAIVPPHWHGKLPKGIDRIESPTPQLFLLGRFRATDDADVAKVHELATQISLEPLSTITGTAPAPPPPPFGSPPGTAQNVATAGVKFYDELGDVLAINPPVDAQQRHLLRSFANLGIGPGRHPSTEVSDPKVQAALTDGVRLGQQEIDNAAATAQGPNSNGWHYNLNIGTYDHNYLLRAVVADIGWGANIPAEAVYAHAETDSSGTPLNGAQRYVLHFPPGGLPPVNAFWSVTLYGPDHFFIANPINRYAISDSTPGVLYGSDGSLDIYIQHDPPPGHESNWLPAPTGAFYLSLRLYLPKPEVLDGTYTYPTIEAQP